jgi:hypothetical protein
MKTWSPRVSTDLNSEPLPWDENLFQKKIQGMKLGWIFGMNWWFYRVQPMRLILQHRTGIIYIWSCAYCTSLHKFLGLTDNDYGPLREKKTISSSLLLEGHQRCANLTVIVVHSDQHLIQQLGLRSLEGWGMDKQWQKPDCQMEILSFSTKEA